MSRYELVIVGGGNMGAALLTGLVDDDGFTSGSVAVVEVSSPRRDLLIADLPTVDVLAEMPPCDGAVLAVKPPDVPAAASSAVAAGAQRLLSIAAGVRTAAIEEAAGPGVAVVRAMPNTPALVGRGASAITAGASAADTDLDWAQSILTVVGRVDRLPEHLLDAFTGLAGSGPAYLFLVAEALVEAGVAAGLTRSLASDVTSQLFCGVGAMLDEQGDAGVLRANVTSPGGTTAAGLLALEQRAVRAAFIDAVAAATARSRELG